MARGPANCFVWAVNPRHDTLVSLASYLCQFAQHFLKPAKLRCHLEVARNLPPAPLNAEQRYNLFLAFKEALVNAVKHSAATEIRLGIAVEERTLAISLADNGRGLAQDALREANGADGLANMRHRLQRLGGRCELTSQPGQGTTVVFKVPLERVDDEVAR
jgi:signal transduction histidine kinase